MVSRRILEYEILGIYLKHAENLLNTCEKSREDVLSITFWLYLQMFEDVRGVDSEVVSMYGFADVQHAETR